MANDNTVSVDEFLNARKGFVKSGDILVKAAVNPPSSWNATARTARFVMSAEVEDRDKDIVVQAGLDITEFLKNPIAPFQHKSRDFPIGTWTDVEKKDAGRPKRTEGVLNLLPEGKDGVADRLAFHIDAGTIRACSIGFLPKVIKRREQSQPTDGYVYPGYMIEQAELIECSPCSIPANPAALAKAAADGDTIARDLIEEVLDGWAKNPANGLIIPRADFEKAYRDAAGDKTVVVLGGKSFTLTEVTPPEPEPEIPGASGFFKRMEELIGRIVPLSPTLPQGKTAEEIKAEADAKAADEQAEKERLESLRLKATVVEGRIAPKIGVAA